MLYNIPGQSVTKKRNTYASLFDRFNASADTEITDEQKASLFRKGLLNFAVNSLATKGQGFGASAAAGLSGGLLAMDEGAQQIGNDRYKNEILARTRQGMERNTQMEQLAGKYMGADGQFDHDGYANELARFDPQASLEYKSKLQPPGRKNPGQPVYMTSADGQYEEPYLWDESQGRLVPAQQFMGQGGAQPIAQPQQGGAGFQNLIGGLLKREGGYVADDAGKGPTNFGINSAANPDVDVRNLTPEKAMELYRQRYWLPIGGDNLPPAIQSAALDAAVNQGPAKAKEWIAMAGNDPRKFAELRQAHYDGLVASNPQKYGQYADSWRNRNMETAGIAPQSAPATFGRRPRKGDDNEGAIPSGYRKGMDGNLEPIPGGPADRKNNPTASDLAKGEQSMRKELQSAIQDQRASVAAYQNLESQAGGGGISDAALIIGYMKTLDPTSVVRESEFATIQNATGLDERLRSYIKRTVQGDKLTPEQRSDILQSAKAYAEQASQRITAETKTQQDIARQYGYDPVRSTGMADFSGVTATVEKGGKPGRSIKRTGTLNGRKVVEYSDGTTEYAD